MTVTINLNGETKIVLTPQNEIEKLILKSLVTIKFEHVSELVIMNKPLPDSIILTNNKTD